MSANTASKSTKKCLPPAADRTVPMPWHPAMAATPKSPTRRPARLSPWKRERLLLLAQVGRLEEAPRAANGLDYDGRRMRQLEAAGLVYLFEGGDGKRWWALTELGRVGFYAPLAAAPGAAR